MWIESACTSVGYGRTDEAAVTRAITRALAATREKFNAAELSVVRVSRYFGLHIAKATLYSRHIQQSSTLGLLDGAPVRQLA